MKKKSSRRIRKDTLERAELLLRIFRRENQEGTGVRLSHLHQCLKNAVADHYLHEGKFKQQARVSELVKWINNHLELFWKSSLLKPGCYLAVKGKRRSRVLFLTSNKNDPRICTGRRRKSSRRRTEDRSRSLKNKKSK